jgi:hypothetical protein
MATNDYSDLQSRVQNRLIDAPAFVTAEVPALINQAIREMEDRHNYWIMKATVTANTVIANGHTLVAKPGSFKAFRDKPYFTEDGGSVRRIKVAPSLEAANRAYRTDDDGFPQDLVFGDPTDESGTVTILVYPLPDGNSDYTDGEYRITIPYWKYLANLSSNTDTNWFTQNCPIAIEALATSKGFKLDWDEARADRWFKDYLRYEKEARRLDSSIWGGGHDTLIPRMGADSLELDH